MTTHPRDVAFFEKCLADYKLKAQEMNVGVNYSALDDERRRQEHLLRELQSLEDDINAAGLSRTKLPHLASVVGVELDQNTKCLTYLTGISELERSVADVAAHFAARSVELSDPNSIHLDVFTYKTLSGNVKSCWDYVDQLVTLAQIHLKSSAEYHQFYHEANEIEAKLANQMRITQKRQQNNSGRKLHKETSRTANELREQLDMMRSLWKRSMAIVRQSEQIVPMRMRLGGVSNGVVTIAGQNDRPVMVRAMVSLTGPDYKIKQGDHLPLVDNRQDPHLWCVRTSSGIVEVPSICFWLTGSDTDAINRAIAIKKQCKEVWLEIVQLSQKRLYQDFTEMMLQLASQKTVYCTSPEALNDLLRDIHTLLVKPLGDDGNLRAAVDAFKQKVKIQQQVNRVSENDLILREADVIRIRAPLLRLQDHLSAIGLMHEDMKRLNDHIIEYLREVDGDRQRITGKLDKLNTLTTESQEQLKDLVADLNQWTSNSPIQSNRGRYTKGASQLKDNSLIGFTDYAKVTSASGKSRSRSQPGMVHDLDPGDPRTHGKRNPSSKRAHSLNVQVDAMVQIGMECRTVETQYQPTEESGQFKVLQTPVEQKHKYIQLSSNNPLQRNVITQIGASNKVSSIQVDSDSLGSVTSEIRSPPAFNKRKNITKRPISTTDTSEHEYLINNQKPLNNAQKIKQYNSMTQIGVLPRQEEKVKRRSASSDALQRGRSPVFQMHGCTQVGIITKDKAMSPVRDIFKQCPHCQKTLVSSQAQIGWLSSNTIPNQDDAYSNIHSLQESNFLFSKRVQSGHTCITQQENLYTQCSVNKLYEDAELEAHNLSSQKEININEQFYEVQQEAFYEQQQKSKKPVGKLVSKRIQTGYSKLGGINDSDSQIGPIYPITNEEMKLPADQVAAATQIGVFKRNHVTSPILLLDNVPIVESIPVDVMSRLPDDYVNRRNMKVQSGYPTLGCQESCSTVIEQKLFPKEVSDASLYMHPPEQHVMTQIGPILSQTTTQTMEFYNAPVTVKPVNQVSKRIQTGNSSLCPLSNSFFQIGSIYSHKEKQTSPEEDMPMISPFNTNPQQSRYELMPDDKQELQNRTPPKPNVYNSMTQIANLLAHEEMQTEALPLSELSVRRKLTKRSQSADTLYFDNATQISKLLSHDFMQTVQLSNSDENVVSRNAFRKTSFEFETQPLHATSTRSNMAQIGQMVYHQGLDPISSLTDEISPTAQGLNYAPIGNVAFQEMNCQVMSEPIPLVNEPRYQFMAPPKLKSHNKKMQYGSTPNLKTSQMQIGQLLKETDTQTGIAEVNVEPENVVALAHMEQHAAAPDVGTLETETRQRSHGKKLQVDVMLAECNVEVVKEEKKKKNKKMQVDLMKRTETCVVSLETDYVPNAQCFDVSCDAQIYPESQSKKIQVETPEEIQMITHEQPVFAVPPTPLTQDVFMQTQPPAMQGRKMQVNIIDAPKLENIRVQTVKPASIRMESRSCDAKELEPKYNVSQQTPLLTSGKKLQVNLQVIEKPTPMSIASVAVEKVEEEPVLIAEPKPVVFSAPPEDDVITVDAFCDVNMAADRFDVTTQSTKLEPLVFAQSQIKVAPLKTHEVLSNTSPLPLCTSMHTQSDPVFEPKPVTFGKKLQVSIVTLSETFSSQTERPKSKGVDVVCQSDPIIVKEVETFGKKIQVDTFILETSQVQTDALKPVKFDKDVQFDTIPEPDIIQSKTPEPIVMSAPPPMDMPDMTDTSCDPMPSVITVSAFTQPKELETAGKNLQVSPPGVLIGLSEVLMAQKHYAFSACSTKRILTKDDASQCDPTVVEKPIVFGKKMQVNMHVMETSKCQTDVLKPKYEDQSVLFESVVEPQMIKVMTPEPVVMFAPPSQSDTIDTSCDPLPSLATSVAFTQPMKIETFGKKLQVSLFKPVEYAVAACTVKLFSTPQTVQCQTTNFKPQYVDVSVQFETVLEPVIVKPKTPEPIVMSAPPPAMPDMRDNSCDALPTAVTTVKNMQVELPPLSIALSQAVMVKQEYAAMTCSTKVIKVVSQNSAVQVESVPISKPITTGKKLQVDMVALETTQCQSSLPHPKHMYGCVQTEKVLEPVVMRVKTPEPIVMSAPPPDLPDMHDNSCDPIPAAEKISKKLQVTPEPEVTPGKFYSVQAEPSPQGKARIGVTYAQTSSVPLSFQLAQVSSAPQSYEITSCSTKQIAPVVIEKPLTYGKKLQANTMQFEVSRSQTTLVKPKFSDEGVQFDTVQEPVMIKAKTPEPIVMSAPPPDLPVMHDSSCDPLKPKLTYECAAQCDTFVEKKRAPLDTTVTQTNVEKPLCFDEAVQFDTVIEPVIIKPKTPEPIVMSAPPPDLPDMQNSGCDPLPSIEKISKKSQVTPEPEVTPGKFYSVQAEPSPPGKMKTAILYAQTSSAPLALKVAPQTYEVTACSTKPIPPVVIEKPVTFGKKLQVELTPFEVSKSQTTVKKPQFSDEGVQFDTVQEPVMIKAKTPDPVVMSAPPPDLPDMHDNSCDPIPAVEKISKKLQVTPEPEVTPGKFYSVQAEPSPQGKARIGVIYAQTSSVPLSFKLAQVFSAPQPYEVTSCSTEPIAPVVIEKPLTYGKKLQANTMQFEVSKSQTTLFNPKFSDEGVQFDTVQEPVMIKAKTPEPIVMSAPPPDLPDMQNSGCDPLPSIEKISKELQVTPEPEVTQGKFYSVQAEPSPPGKMKTAILYAQTSSAPLALKVAPQTYEVTACSTKPIPPVVIEKPVTFGKKLQVELTQFEVFKSQTTVKKPQFSDEGVQFDTVQEPVMIKAKTPEPIVMSAPPPDLPDMQNSGCDPLPSIEKISKELQVTPEPEVTQGKFYSVQAEPSPPGKMKTAILYAQTSSAPLALKVAPQTYEVTACSTKPIPPVVIEKPVTFGKKLQVELTQFEVFKSQTTVKKPQFSDEGVQFDTVQEPVMIKAKTPEPIVMSAPPPDLPDMQNSGCDPLPSIEKISKELQVTPEPEVTQGKFYSVQAEPSPPGQMKIAIRYARTSSAPLALKVAPQTYEVTACSTKPIPSVVIEKPVTFGKKLQVELTPFVVSKSQTTIKKPKFSDEGVQFDTIQEPVMIKAKTPEPVVMSAPPSDLPDMQDSGCDPLPSNEKIAKKLQVSTEPLILGLSEVSIAPQKYEVLACATKPITPVAIEKPVTYGKKLQVNTVQLDVSRSQTTLVKPKFSDEGVQFDTVEEPFMIKAKTPEPIVMSAPPTDLPDMHDSSCDPIPAVEKISKKLQVTPEPEVKSGKFYSVQAEPSPPGQIKIAIRYAQTSSAPLALKVAPVSIAPQTYKVTACSTKPIPPVVVEKPVTFGKKLQVELPSFEVSKSQTTINKPKFSDEGVQFDTIQEPVMIKAKTPEPVVMSAPPSDLPDMQDSGCDPLPSIEKISKKLQVTQQPEVKPGKFYSVQAEPSTPGQIKIAIRYAQTSSAPLALKVAPVSIAPQTYEVTACSTKQIPPVVIEKPVTLGKKLQVELTPFEVSKSQTTVKKTKFSDEGVQFDNVQEPFMIKAKIPEPVVMSAPPSDLPDMQDSGCDPLPSMEKIAKKLQVSTEPLILGLSEVSFAPQKYEVTTCATKTIIPIVIEKPIMLCKKLQVLTEPLFVTRSETMQPTSVKPKLEQKGVQFEAVPEAVIIKPMTPEHVVMSAPPQDLPEMQDNSCDALPVVAMLGKKLQISPEPLVVGKAEISNAPQPVSLALSETSKDAQPSKFYSVQCEPIPISKSNTLGKKVQVKLDSDYGVSLSQTRFSTPMFEHGAFQTITPTQPKLAVANCSVPTALKPQIGYTISRCQTVFSKYTDVGVQCADVQLIDSIIAKTPEPVVMSAPPPDLPNMQDSSCDPMPSVEKIPKNLQVSLQSMVRGIAQVSMAPQKYALTACSTKFIPPAVYEKPIMCDKNLQLSEGPLVVARSETIQPTSLKLTLEQKGVEFEAVPEPVIIKPMTPEHVVMSAPPQDLPEMQDNGCDALPIVTMLGKKLQVTPESLILMKSQAVLTSQTCLLGSSETGPQTTPSKFYSIQAEPVETESVKIGAGSMKPPSPQFSTSISQTSGSMLMREAPKPISFSKNLQFGPKPLKTSLCQATHVILTTSSTQIDTNETTFVVGKEPSQKPMDPTGMTAVQAQQTKVVLHISAVECVPEAPLIIAAEPIKQVMSAPPESRLETVDTGCDAIKPESTFEVTAQTSEMPLPSKMNLIYIMSQVNTTEDFKPVMIGKKLQVNLMDPTEMTAVQAEQTKLVLHISAVECIPEAPLIISAEPVTQVMSAPPESRLETVDTGCDAIKPESTFEVAAQTSEKPSPSKMNLISITSQVNKTEDAKPVMIGKKLQVNLMDPTEMTAVQAEQTKLVLHISAVECIPEAPLIISAEPVTQAMSAPPQSRLETVDTGCDAIKPESTFEVAAQTSEKPSPSKMNLISITSQVNKTEDAKPVMIGKKLQVNLMDPTEMTAVQAEQTKVVLHISAVECVPEASLIIAAEPIKQVMSAPPQSLLENVDTGCEAIQPESTFEASAQTNVTRLISTIQQAYTTIEINTTEDFKPVMIGKKLQVNLMDPTEMTAVQAEQTKVVLHISAVECVPEAPLIIAAEPITQVMSAPPQSLLENVDTGCEAIKPESTFEATAQTNEKRMISTIQQAYTTIEVNTTAYPKPVMIGKKMQVNLMDPTEMTAVQAEQTKVVLHISAVECLPEAPLIIAAEPITQVMSAPPQSLSETVDTGCEAIKPESTFEATVQTSEAPLPSKTQQSYVTTQKQKPLTFGKKLQVNLMDLDAMGSDGTQKPNIILHVTAVECVSDAPLISAIQNAEPIFAVAPPESLSTKIVAIATIQAKVPIKSVASQAEAIVRKPNCRSVRIQKGQSLFDMIGVDVSVQVSQLDHRPSPILSPRINRIDWGLQCAPTTMIGVTQTLEQIFSTSFKPTMSHQTTQMSPLTLPNILSPEPANLLTFVRETSARVTRGSRTRSQCLVPYKTQVFIEPGHSSASVPAQLNVHVDDSSPTFIREQMIFNQRATTSNVPRRYATRIRSPSARSNLARRNRSLEVMYNRGGSHSNQGLSHRFISEGDIYHEGSSMTGLSLREQQIELEDRCKTCLTQCVQLVGYDKIATMLHYIRRSEEEEEEEEGINEGIECDPRYGRYRRLHPIQTQCTSTTTLLYPEGYLNEFSPVHYRVHSADTIGRSGSEYEWAPLQPAGRPMRTHLEWGTRPDVDVSTQRDLSPQNQKLFVKRLLKNRSLSVYTSDLELQQANIKTHYSVDEACTFVTWKANGDGDDHLELDTVGRLLELTVVGARVPATGEVISAAEAFYRGILRTVYYDEERGKVIPLADAVNCNCLITEKQYPSGVGIYLHSTTKKYPVECQTVWKTPDLRRRVYRVNYIQKSEEEKLNVTEALDEGIIDMFNGEIVKIGVGSVSLLSDPLTESRESSVGSGDTIRRRIRPERFSIYEAILNDILDVDILGSETIVLGEDETVEDDARQVQVISPEDTSEMEV